MRADVRESGGLCLRPSLTAIGPAALWAPPSPPPRLPRPRGMRSPMSMPSSTRCWRGHGGRRYSVDPFRAEAAADRSGAAQHGDLVCLLLRPAVAGDWTAIPFGTLYTL